VKRLVVYTAVFGGRDPIRLPPADADFDFLAFTDSPIDDPRVVQMPMLVPGDPRRSSRRMKILPDVFLTRHRYSLWIDGSVLLKTGNLDHLVDRYLSGEVPLATFRHPLRTCAYQEASVCVTSRLGDPAVVQRQADGYRLAGMPEGTGLAETGVILRDHNGVIGFSRVWWEEVQSKSCRDQISFPFAAWITGLRWAGFEDQIRQSDLFQLMPHN